MMSRVCSQCGNNGHNSRTCPEASGGGEAAAGGGETGSKGIMLFGVRVTEGSSFRKSASMNNLAQYEQPPDSNPDLAAGYASDDVVHASARNRERKRGVPWTEEEHKLFLLGLQKVGKGDWRGISRNFVKTRTPTQVASHAQKYFLRRNNHNRRRRRSSLFDMTPEAFMDSVMEEDQIQEGIISHPPRQPYYASNNQRLPVLLPVTGDISGDNLFSGHTKKANCSPNLSRPVPFFPVPPSSKMAHLNLNHTPTVEPLPSLSLKLSVSQSPPTPTPPLPPSGQNLPPPGRRSSGFQGMSGSLSSSSGDSIISVA